MCGVTQLDKIRNEGIRWMTNVGEISRKGQEKRLSCYKKRSGLYGKKNDGIGSTVEEEEGQAKTAMDGQN